ncbi:hypothetical protein M422DRAFT_232171 [Sphaerobolus stellatus SS14]|uniref:60S ribosomal export protein NMD3 n=1 Tax=Sphaerobolus stellatus (strain SS14) TaxID=990650 RepID=A0A0C9VHF4_SPHS4|nr:hypothetical protein M422DRAFT_260625 [Sphaerobolus stellatus SS14]KIJ36979.1 hypothetical protein M422DRAFT_232171 [Sphaerobolus stellatus SS14]
MEFTPGPAVHRVLCADCGTVIEPNSANLCINCLRNSVDITEGIPKQSSLSFCRNCERFLSPPMTWTSVEPESRELLAICLKKLKGLSKVRLVDAGFIWTEPHSKRLKVKLTIQKEVFTNTILQQIFQVEYVVQHGQCPDCTRLAAKNTWKAMVQVRQKVPHKRTFLFLEQLILKHNAQKDTISVKEVKDGLDFFYSQRSHAIKMTDFLAGVVPVRMKASEQLISADTHTNTANFKYSYSVEIAPICKDDLVVIPLKLARSLGNMSQLAVCTRVGNSIHLTDPATLQTCEVTASVYWRQPFESIAAVTDLFEFTILDVDPSGHTKGKFVAADAQVARANAFLSKHNQTDDGMDEGVLDQVYHTRTHLGGILQPGDSAMGYHLSGSNFNSDEFAALSPDRIPDVILVKKAYPAARKKHKTRAWRLKSMAKEVEEESGPDNRKGVIGKLGGRDQKKVEQDYEIFLRDLEEDTEMRSAVNLYKTPGAGSGLAGGKNKTIKKAREAARSANDMDMDEEQQPTETESGMDDDEAEVEADYPEIQLDELLDDFNELAIADEEAGV